jgi:hypothetical protein
MYRFGRFEECLYYQISVSSVCIIRCTEYTFIYFYYRFGYVTRPIGVIMIKVLLIFKTHALLKNWNEVVLVYSGPVLFQGLAFDSHILDFTRVSRLDCVHFDSDFKTML